MNAAYSFGLKHIAVLDLVLVSSGFVFRVFAGAVVTQVVPTHWIILMTFLLALFITLAKRRDDIRLANEGLTIRKNIGQYNLEFINASMIIMASVIIVGYILYTVSVDVQDRFHAPYLYLTVVFILVGIMRYLQITFVENASGDPTKIFLKDRFLQCTVAGWMGTFLLMVYH
jgi:4-hydroxybenzoate polyprenyltransferase